MLEHQAPHLPGLQQRPQTGAETDTQKDIVMLDPRNPSAVKVTLIGAGGCGLNLVRPMMSDQRLHAALYFDTSMVNSRPGETVYTVGKGDGSGSNRAENARDIEREIPQISDEHMGVGDVAIVVFSFAGGSGSVIAPLMIRDLNKRGVRVIGVGVADAGSSVGAKNSLNTLKTLTSICKNNDLYLPMIILSNDAANRSAVDAAATILINDLIDLLTKPVFEIDRNDRMNWINPSKIVSTQSGMKILSLVSDRTVPNPKVIIGADSKEMVDSLLILKDKDDESEDPRLPPARLKKTGIYSETNRKITGKVSSDIKEIDNIIDRVEKMEHQDRSQKHQTVDRLNTGDSDDLIL